MELYIALFAVVVFGVLVVMSFAYRHLLKQLACERDDYLARFVKSEGQLITALCVIDIVRSDIAAELSSSESRYIDGRQQLARLDQILLYLQAACPAAPPPEKAAYGGV